MKEKLFLLKPLSLLQEEASDTKGGLKRSLTATNLILLGIGAIIGTGVFVLTGTAAANYAGPALALSFIISGVGCVFAGLCYAEFASMIPIAGSAYTYSYATLGEFVAWIIGWDLILEYLFASSTVAVGWSGYVVKFLQDLHINLPAYLCASPIIKDAKTGELIFSGAIINFPAVFIVLLTTSLLYVGVQQSAKVNGVIVFVKVTVVLLFIGFGISYINPTNWHPFIPENTGVYGHFGVSGIIRGAAVIFFAYIGFDAVSTAAQEAKNPQRDMPVGILGSLVVCTILYIAVALVLTGIVSYKELNDPAPIALAINKTGDTLNWLKPLIKIGAIGGLSSVILVMLMGQPRIFYSMSKDGLLPPIFSKVHPKYKTPYISTIICGLVCAFFAGFFPIDVLGELVSIGTLLAFVIVCLGIIVLRRKKPDIERPFKTPFVPIVPILGALICLYQMYALPADTWIRLIVWMVLGFLIYFFYSVKHSKLRK